VTGFRQQLSTTSFEAFELEITLNYPVHIWTENGSFMRNLTSWSVPFWLVLLTEHEVLQCYVLNVVCRCLVAGQLYPSCGFSSADCRCFQVSDPCQAIHSTAFVLQTALTDRDYLIKIACFCKMILFHFYWYLGLDSFPR